MPLKALKCPICGELAVFTVTSKAVEGATKYPVPFEVTHRDHTFTVYLDSALLISRVEKGGIKTHPKSKTKRKPKSTTTKRKAKKSK